MISKSRRSFFLKNGGWGGGWWVGGGWVISIPVNNLAKAFHKTASKQLEIAQNSSKPPWKHLETPQKHLKNTCFSYFRIFVDFSDSLQKSLRNSSKTASKQLKTAKNSSKKASKTLRTAHKHL
jgi:hypothetical protein